MCMMVYLGSGRPLPTSEWDEAHPAFYVTELSQRDEAVRCQFSQPIVYYLGSHQGCGCGFQSGEIEGIEDDPVEWLASKETWKRLCEYLTESIRNQPETELFACWDGDQAAEPEFRERISPAELLRDRKFLRDKEWLCVTEAV